MSSPDSSRPEAFDLAVVALSARALAASARRAGLRALSVDLFADADTREHAALAVRADASRRGLGFDRKSLIETLATHAPAGLPVVLGAGFEHAPALMRAIAARNPILGATPDQVKRLKDPFAFAGLLGELGVPHPHILRTCLPGSSSAKRGLCERLRPAVFPSPLRGGVRGGGGSELGSPSEAALRRTGALHPEGPPPLTPPRKGEGDASAPFLGDLAKREGGTMARAMADDVPLQDERRPRTQALYALPPPPPSAVPLPHFAEEETGAASAAARLLSSPSPLAGEGRGEGALQDAALAAASSSILSRPLIRPAADAASHLLPQGEKEEELYALPPPPPSAVPLPRFAEEDQEEPDQFAPIHNRHARACAGIHDLGVGLHDPGKSWIPSSAGHDSVWLSKRAGASGGAHIRSGDRIPPTKGRYLQAFVPGRAVSALFLADGRSARIVGFSEQWADHTHRAPFRYGGAVGPIALPAPLGETIASALDRIVAATALTGLASADMIVSDDGASFHLLEINPRPGATLDVFDHDETSLLRLHIEACAGRLPAALPSPAEARAAAVVYAERPVQIVTLRRPLWTADWPSCDETLPAGAPVCTALASAPTPAEAYARVTERRAALLASLRDLARSPTNAMVPA